MMLHENEDYWIPLADVMTGMMLIFMLTLAIFMLKTNSSPVKMVRKINTVNNSELSLDQYRAMRGNLGLVIESDFSQFAMKYSGVHLDAENLSISFSDANLLFPTGQSQPSLKFKQILDEFFPALLLIAQDPKYSQSIKGISIEGFSSSKWAGKTTEEAFLKNMKLSEDRSFNVFNYLFTNSKFINQHNYLMNNVSVVGNSSTHLIKLKDGAENTDSSQRVEFRIVLNPPLN